MYEVGEQHEGDEGQLDEGQPDEGQPDEGQPDEGQPDEGQPDEGQPDEGQPDEEGRFFDLRVRINVARRGEILYKGSDDCLEPGNEVLVHVAWLRGDEPAMLMTADCWPTLIACGTWTCGEDCIPATIHAAGCPG